MSAQRETFGSRAAVIMALAGSAIGLGNIWRFPYVVGENGGAAFIVVYILCTLLLSLPIFLAESVIGRRSGANCRGAMERLAPGTAWKWLGYLSVLTPMIIVSYYSVIGGWSLDYLFKSLSFRFVRVSPEGMFSALAGSTWTPLLFHTLFLGASLAVVALGVKGGIEKFSKICLPVLFVLIVAIAVFSLTLPGAGAGAAWLLKPDFSKLSPRTFVTALGQSFYSLSLGMGIIITYSSYVHKDENLLVSGAGTALSDLVFALLAGFAIMPAVFAAGIEPGSGPGLIFDTLPYIFHQMGQTMPVVSSVAAILFFVTILFAAMTSTVSLLEVGVAFLIEEKGLRRPAACAVVFGLTWTVGILCSLSFGPLAGVKLFGSGIFDFLDMFSSNVLLTLGGLLAVLFVGWHMKKTDVRDEFTNAGSLKAASACFGVFWFIVRYLAPPAILLIFLTNFL